MVEPSVEAATASEDDTLGQGGVKSFCLQIARLAARLIFPTNPDVKLVPVLAVTFISTTAFSGLWAYIGIWAITALGASTAMVGVMYLAYAICASIAGYLGGMLSDRLGRRRIMALSWAIQATFILLLPFTQHKPTLGLAIAVIATVAGSPAMAASSAVVADVMTEGDREKGFAQNRTVFNLGNIIGPPLVGLLLLTHLWLIIFIVVSALGLISSTIAWRYIPVGTHSIRDAKQPSLSMLRNAPFQLLLLSTVMAFFLYQTFATVLPIVAVTSFKLAPSLWGVILVINPITVVLVQMRITQATSRLSAEIKLGAATLLMGLPFLALLVLGNVWGIIIVVSLFVLGEMLWAPTSQALAAEVATPGNIGAYMGMFRGSGQVGVALAPLLVLHLHSASESLTWWFVAAIGVSACIVAVLACIVVKSDHHLEAARMSAAETDMQLVD